MAEVVTALVIGAGNRGSNYADYSLVFPGRFKVVGVAEPRNSVRRNFQIKYEIPQEMVFISWEMVTKIPKCADCVVIATPDRLHKEPAVAFAKLGYHILLEKPMAVTPEDCQEIVDTCQQNGTILAVCHVLRYFAQALKIKEILDDGIIGHVANIQLTEPIGFYHFAHSFVRGNWRKEASSTFSLLAKSCHDLDLILYWMSGAKCTRVSSTGSLFHFKPDNKPVGAGARCLDCPVERTCPYSAKKIYLDTYKKSIWRWPHSVVSEIPDIESLTIALATGPYGRCVYECDNDVLDNQVVNFQFEGGETASFSMVAFTDKLCKRQVKIYGTRGELTCGFESLNIYVYDFNSREQRCYDLTLKGGNHDKTIGDKANGLLSGHGGADLYTIHAFVNAIQNKDPSLISTGPQETLTSHLLVFAAEKARREGSVINPQTECLNGYFK